jgi:putative heme iron utilization protein
MKTATTVMTVMMIIMIIITIKITFPETTHNANYFNRKQTTAQIRWSVAGYYRINMKEVCTCLPIQEGTEGNSYFHAQMKHSQHQ